MNIKSYIAASVVASISISASSVAMAGDTYYAAKDCPKSSNVIDKYGFYKCYCTSYVADKIATTSDSSFKNSSLSNAFNWKDAAAKIGYTSDTTPKAGDIAWWGKSKGSPDGHVAYVESVNADGTVNISEYNYDTSLGYGTRKNKKADSYLRKSSVSTKVTLSSVGVTCPSSVWDFDNSAGTCSTKAYYSDNSNKSVTANSWSSNSTTASISNGTISTKDVSKDETVKFTASYTEGPVTKTSSEASVVVKNLPDGTDPKDKCDSDVKTTEYPVYNDNKNPKKPTGLLGNVQLRYSPSCKAAWGRIDLTSKEKAMTVKSTTISTSRTGKSTYTSPSVSLNSTSYANIALLRVSGDQVCAIGTINGKSPTTIPCKKL